MKITIDFKELESTQNVINRTKGAFSWRQAIEIWKKQFGAEKIVIRQGGKKVIEG